MKRWILMLMIALLLVPAASGAQETDETPSQVVCDADLMLSLYIAEYYFDYAVLLESMTMEAGVEVLDLGQYAQGQYAPMFDLIEADDLIGEMSDEGIPTMIMTIMLMTPEERAELLLEHGIDSELLNDELPVIGVEDEPLECAALRDELREFYHALAIVSLLESADSSE